MDCSESASTKSQTPNHAFAPQHAIHITDLYVAKYCQGDEVWDAIDVNLNVPDQSHQLHHSLVCHMEPIKNRLWNRQSQPHPFLLCNHVIFATTTK
jgi:hypothetical protein